jgi:hypothetical protein
MEVATTTIDWTIDRSSVSDGAVKRFDSDFMLCLLRLESWPNLEAVHRDWVDVIQLICTMLDKRPMVGFLVARRLKLPIDKTETLLSMLHIKGHIATIGANSLHLSRASQVYLHDSHEEAATKPNRPLTLANHAGREASTGNDQFSISDDADVFNQLWRVLNTDIAFKKTQDSNLDDALQPKEDAGKVLSKLWRILNTGMKAQSNSHSKSVKQANYEPNLTQTAEHRSENVLKQVWSVLNTDITFRRHVKDLDQSAGTALVGKAVRQSSSEDSEAKAKLSLLWRILETEITLKNESKSYVMKSSSFDAFKSSATETPVAPVSRFDKAWEFLNSEISVAVPTEHGDYQSTSSKNN